VTAWASRGCTRPAGRARTAGAVARTSARERASPAGPTTAATPSTLSPRRRSRTGYGAAGHIAIQIARGRGAEVYVCTRDRDRHQRLAEELGAAWVGGTVDAPPVPLDAAIVFAPAGEIVPSALRALDRGGRLVLGGIHMSPIPPIDYQDLYWERGVQSVANNTRADGRAFLEEAARIGVRTQVETFPLEDANDALIALKHDAIRGAAVLEMKT
jgi:propanol-preferring alcohol dehydrogenase